MVEQPLIVLVDDDAAYLELASDPLSDEGYAVLKVTNIKRLRY